MINKIKVISFLLMIYGLMFIFILTPKEDKSELENRKLKSFPSISWESIFSGKYMQNIDKYVDDHFSFRNYFLKISKKIRGFHGISLKSVPKIIKPTKRTDSRISVIPLDSIDVDALEEEKSHGLLIFEGAAYQIFGGNNSSASSYVSLINDFRAAIPNQVRIIDIVIPSSTPFIKSPDYSHLRRREYGNIEYIGSKLNPSVKYIQAAENMLDHEDEYLFFRTDHHWNGLGVFYAYEQFSKELGLPYFQLNELTSFKIPKFTGSLYSKTMEESLLENPDILEYYKVPVGQQCFLGVRGSMDDWRPSALLHGYANGVNSYGVFLGGDKAIMKVVSNNKNGRRAVLVKNSFGNPFATLIYHHYEELYIVDLRYFKKGLLNLIKDKLINDVIILNGVFSANSIGTQRLMGGLISDKTDFSDFNLIINDSIMASDSLSVNSPLDSLFLEQKLDTTNTKSKIDTSVVDLKSDTLIMKQKLDTLKQ